MRIDVGDTAQIVNSPPGPDDPASRIGRNEAKNGDRFV
jgi:hypothetical protein